MKPMGCIDRRRVIGASGTIFASILAGCLGDSDNGDSPRRNEEQGVEDQADSQEDNREDTNENAIDTDPGTARGDETVSEYEIPQPGTIEYLNWVPVIDDRVQISYVDRATLRTVQAEIELSSTQFEAIDDTLLSLPLHGVLTNLTTATAQLQRLGLESTFHENGDDLESTIDQVLVATGSIVCFGSIGSEEIRTRLADDSESIGLVKSDSINGFSLHETSASADRQVHVGVADDALIIGPTRDRVTNVIEAALSERHSPVLEDDDFEWLVSAISSGQLVYGEFRPSGLDSRTIDAYPELSHSRGFLVSHDYDQTILEASMGVVYDLLDVDTRTKLDATVGSMADEPVLEFGNDRITASATYPFDILDTL